MAIVGASRIFIPANAGDDNDRQVRGGMGLFSGKPPYVWISNQIGNTGVLYGFIQNNSTDSSSSSDFDERNLRDRLADVADLDRIGDH